MPALYFFFPFSLAKRSFRSLPTCSAASSGRDVSASCTFLLDMQHARPSQKSWNICSSAFQRGGTSLSSCVPSGGCSWPLSKGTACKASSRSGPPPRPPAPPPMPWPPGIGSPLGVGVGRSMRIVIGTRREVDLLKHMATIWRRARSISP